MCNIGEAGVRNTCRKAIVGLIILGFTWGEIDYTVYKDKVTKK